MWFRSWYFWCRGWRRGPGLSPGRAAVVELLASFISSLYPAALILTPGDTHPRLPLPPPSVHLFKSRLSSSRMCLNGNHDLSKITSYTLSVCMMCWMSLFFLFFILMSSLLSRLYIRPRPGIMALLCLFSILYGNVVALLLLFLKYYCSSFPVCSYDVQNTATTAAHQHYLPVRVTPSSLFRLRFHFFCTAWVCGQTACRCVCSSHLPLLGKKKPFCFCPPSSDKWKWKLCDCFFSPIIHFTWFTLRVTRRKKVVQKPQRPKGHSSWTRAVFSSSPQALLLVSNEWIKGSCSGSMALFIWMVASIVSLPVISNHVLHVAITPKGGN